MEAPLERILDTSAPKEDLPVVRIKQPEQYVRTYKDYIVASEIIALFARYQFPAFILD